MQSIMKKRVNRVPSLLCLFALLPLLIIATSAKSTDAARLNSICTTCHGASLKDIHHNVANIDCTECHKSVWDPDLGVYLTETILNCADCHDPDNFHIAEHDVACPTCHVLEDEDGDGTILNIHGRVRPTNATICADCHRHNDPDSIFTVQVNDDPNEPPDYDYPVQQYLYGPCATCHGNKVHMGNDGAKGCLPCHFAELQYSYPSDPNGFIGSQTWGHNFKKRNNPGKTVGDGKEKK